MAIAPAAGFVAIPQSIFIGAVAAVTSNTAVYWRSKTRLDDPLDVFPCQGIGGMAGMIMTGIFATKTVNSAGQDGWYYGDPAFFCTQIKVLLIVVPFSFIVSFLIFKFVNSILPICAS